MEEDCRALLVGAFGCGFVLICTCWSSIEGREVFLREVLTINTEIPMASSNRKIPPIVKPTMRPTGVSFVGAACSIFVLGAVVTTPVVPVDCVVPVVAVVPVKA
jgi:hypothetical protein